jgi:DNA-binding GntR family transcriptional regulator
MLKQKTNRFSRSLFAKDILQQLRTDIITGQITSGYRLVESQLANEYGVSRGPIRSALHALEQEGLIQSLPSGGAQVVGFSEKHALDLFDVRQHLEKIAAGLIVQKETISIEPLLSISELMSQEKLTDEQMADLDINFHMEFVRMADNWSLLQTWTTLSPVIRTIIIVTTSIYENRSVIANNHLQLAKALESKDVALISKLIDNQINTTKKLITEQLNKMYEKQQTSTKDK